MKAIETTKKFLSHSYSKIISVGYCQAQFLLSNTTKVAFIASKSNGWQSDAYVVDGVLISTGYAPLKAKGTAYDRQVLEELERRASLLSTSEEDKRLKQKMLSDFVEYAVENYAQ